MKRSFWVIVWLAAAVTAFAADPQEILDIRARYQSVASLISQNKLFVNEYVFNKTALALPGLGFMTTTVRQYYDYFPEVEGEMLLYKTEVTETYHSDGSTGCYSEFVYGEDGSLVFCYKKYSRPNPADNVERRFYFRGGRTVRIQEGDKILDPSSPDYKPFAEEVVSESSAWYKLFRRN